MISTVITRRSVLKSTGIVFASGLTGCLSGSASQPRVVEMTDDLTFEPQTVTVSQGGTVVWENAGAADHTVTAYENEIPDGATYFASGGFESEQAARQNIAIGLIGSGESYQHTFDVGGEYEYYCIPHESSQMVGTVRVR